MATEDSRNKPLNGGMYRIFQQSVKELGSLKEHKTISNPQLTAKRPFKGCKNLGINKYSSSEDVKKMYGSYEMERNEDSVVNENDVIDKTYSKHPQKHVRSDSDRSKILRRDEYFLNMETNRGGFSKGFIGRDIEPIRGRSYLKEEIQHMGPQSSIHRKFESCSVKQSSFPKASQTISGEDWSQDLIDTASNKNKNITTGTEGICRVKSEKSVMQIEQIACDPCMSTTCTTDDENNNTEKFSPCIKNDLNRNIQSTLNELSEQSSDTDCHPHVSSMEERFQNVCDTNLPSDTVTRRSDDVVEYMSDKSDKLKKINELVIDAENLNNNENFELSSCPKHKESHVWSEDWSLELHEVHEGLFKLRKSELPSIASEDLMFNHNERNIYSSNTTKKSDFNFESGIKKTEDSLMPLGDGKESHLNKHVHISKLHKNDISETGGDFKKLDSMKIFEVEKKGLKTKENYDHDFVPLNLDVSIVQQASLVETSTIQEEKNMYSSYVKQAEPFEILVESKVNPSLTLTSTDPTLFSYESKLETISLNNSNDTALEKETSIPLIDYLIAGNENDVNNLKMLQSESEKILIDDKTLEFHMIVNSAKHNDTGKLHLEQTTKELLKCTSRVKSSCSHDLNSKRNDSDSSSNENRPLNVLMDETAKHYLRRTTQSVGENARDDINGHIHTKDITEGVDDSVNYSQVGVLQEQNKYSQSLCASAVTDEDIGRKVKTDEPKMVKPSNSEGRNITERVQKTHRLKERANISPGKAESHHKHSYSIKAHNYDRKRHCSANYKYSSAPHRNYYERYIPPRFMPINSSKFNKYRHEKGPQFIEPMWPYSSPKSNIFYTRGQSRDCYTRPFCRRDGFNISRTRLHENGNKRYLTGWMPVNRRGDVMSARTLEQKAKVKEQDQLVIKVPTTASYEAEDWHAEIDEKIKDIENAIEVMAVAEKDEVTDLVKENLEQIDNTQRNDMLEPLLSMIECKDKIESQRLGDISDDKNCKQVHGIPYLPPSPDETEQAMFISYITLKENLPPFSKADESVQSSRSFIDDTRDSHITNASLNVCTDLKNAILDDDSIIAYKEKSTTCEDRQSNKVKLDDKSVSENLESIFRFCEEQSESDSYKGLSRYVKSLNSDMSVDFDQDGSVSDSRATREVVFEMGGSNQNNECTVTSDTQNLVLDLQSDQGFDTENIDSPFLENDDTCNSQAVLSGLQSEEYIIASEPDELVKCFDRSSKADTADRVDGSEPSCNEGEMFEIKHKEDTAGKEEQYRSQTIGYPNPSKYFWSGSTVSPYMNQFHSNPWQYCHPSYYYSEEYRRWYEQIYFRNYQRYMQYYGYYSTPYEPYYTHCREETPYSEKDPQFGPEASQNRTIKPEIISRPSCLQSHLSGQCEQNETQHYGQTSETKLSDYWTERMPDWVDKQSKEAKLKNGEKLDDTLGIYCSGKEDGQKIKLSADLLTSCKLEQVGLNKTGNSDADNLVVKENEVQRQTKGNYQKPSSYNTSTEYGKNSTACQVEPPVSSIKNLDGDKRSAVKPTSLLERKQRNKQFDQTLSKDGDSNNGMTASDSNIDLTGTDSGFFSIQRKHGCVCGPDDVQYWLWKTCKCSAGLIPASEDIIPVFQEDRCADLGYQSFDSLVTEDTTPPGVRQRNQFHTRRRTQCLPMYFSTVRHSTPYAQVRLEQDKSSHVIRPTEELPSTRVKVKPPPGFKVQIKETEGLKDSKGPQQANQQARMDKGESSVENSETSSTDSEEEIKVFQYNDKKGIDNTKYRHEQKGSGELGEGIETEQLKGSIHTDEIIKSSKKKSHTQKELSNKKMMNSINDRSKSQNIDSNCLADIRVEVLQKKKEHIAMEQLYNNSAQINNMLLKFKAKLEDSLKESADIVETSSGRWKVEPMNPVEHSQRMAIKQLDDTTDKIKHTPGDRRFEELDNIQNHDIIEVAVKEENASKAELQGPLDPSKHEYSVRLKVPKARNRSCTVSVSDSMAEIELKSTSSGEDRVLDEVQSQSPDCVSEEEGEIKDHVMVEEELGKTGIYSRRTEAMPFPARTDLNNNCMPGVYPGYRMPYRLTHHLTPAFQFEYGPRMAPRNHLSQSDLNEKLPTENVQGKIREETLPEMPPNPWVNTVGPVFQPRSSRETPLFPSPWYMAAPPPPPPDTAMAAERNRFMCRPTFEQHYSSMNQNEFNRPDWYESPQPAAPSEIVSNVTGVTPELNKKLSCSEKSLSQNKLVDYNSSENDSSGSEIEEFDLSSLDSGSNVRKSELKQKSIQALSFDYTEVGHTPKRFRPGSPETSANKHSRKDLPARTFHEFGTTKQKKETLQKNTMLTRQPMRKLKQGVLKSFSSEAVGKVIEPQKQGKEEEKQKMTLSEVIASGLKKTEASSAPDQANRHHSTETLSEQQLYSMKCQQNLPPFPPLPPFPASPFWGMYLTQTKSALEGKDPNEDIYSPTNPAVMSAQSTPSYLKRRSFSPAVRPDSRFLFSPSETDSENQSKKSDGLKQFIRFHSFGVKYIDTHCHLDFLFNRSNFNGNLKKYMEENPDTFPDTFEGCVAIFCYPSSFSPNDEVVNRLIEEDNVWFAMGCHPKMATDFTEAAERGLRHYLKHKKCVGLGEIGLDYSGTFYRHEAVQKAVFRRQLNIAIKFGKPLVIHCRDAEEDCLEIMKEVVPRNYKIHCHCFTKSYANAKLWMEAFPNLYIGLTPLVTYPTATPSHDLARQIPLAKLLLETDAPYFVPRCRPRLDIEFSNPGLAVTVAKAVAQHKDIPVAMVLRQCRVNTRIVYGI